MRSVVSRISHSVRIARFNTEVKAICGSSFSRCSSRPACTASCAAQIAQVDVVPAGEQILDIPDALAVTDQDQFSGHNVPPSDACAAANTPSNSVAERPRRRASPRAGESARGPHARSILRNLSICASAGVSQRWRAFRRAPAKKSHARFLDHRVGGHIAARRGSA